MSEYESKQASNVMMIALRIFLIVICLSAFVSGLNPARLSGLISKNASLFTCAVSYSSTIGSGFIRALSMGWISQSALTLTYIGALLDGLAVIALAAAFCVSLGNLKMRRLSVLLVASASLAGLVGTTALRIAYEAFASSSNVGKIEPVLPPGIIFFYLVFALSLIISVFLWIYLPKASKDDPYEMEARYRLFLMILPFLVLVALFSYLPLWGWRYSFFDYRAGFDLSAENFVGTRWFKYLFSNPATRADIVRVLKNTFAMSGIGIATSWIPMAFAILLTELRSNKAKRIVQTLTTIPNFISWVLVYSVAFAIFSSEGFLNSVLIDLGILESGTNWLMDSSNIWVKMWAWGTWKGLGWGAIIYIAGISGIDQELYEAAKVDGAGRFRRIWHITVPGLLSTYFVMLLLSIANILSNGMDQYLVFYNPANRSTIQVLDLFVYHLGLTTSGSNIPMATLIGMLKSVISVTLLFVANKASKLLRGESIV